MIATQTRILLLLALCLASMFAATLPEPKHEMYICVNVASRGSVMGTKLANLSGLYRVTDRVTPVHVGFNHIRLETISTDPRDRGILYAAALNGILRTTDSGRTWRIMTSWDMTEAKDIAVDQNSPDNIYAGLPDGLAVSRDKGQTWMRRDAGIARKYCQAVVVDRSRAGRLVIGTEKGVFVSEDAAESWTQALRTDAAVHDLRQSPHQISEMFAVTQSNGAFRSSDHGMNWAPVESIANKKTLHNCDYDTTDARRMVVCGWGVGVLLSEDGGKTWVDRTAGLPRREVWRVAFDPDKPSRLYASVFQSPIFVSDDLGRTWKALWFENAVVSDFVFVPRF